MLDRMTQLEVRISCLIDGRKHGIIPYGSLYEALHAPDRFLQPINTDTEVVLKRQNWDYKFDFCEMLFSFKLKFYSSHIRYRRLVRVTQRPRGSCASSLVILIGPRPLLCFGACPTRTRWLLEYKNFNSQFSLIKNVLAFF